MTRPDMSPAAIDQRLRLAAELLRVCGLLGRAERVDVIRESPSPEDESSLKEKPADKNE